MAGCGPAGGRQPPRLGGTRRGRVGHGRCPGSATSATPTVWLCQPGTADDPCASSLTTTVVQASGAAKEVSTQDDNSSPFDCFYVYPTVSKQKTTNANLKVQKPEIAAAVYEASRFSTVCRVWAPMYRQVTLAGLAASRTSIFHLRPPTPPTTACSRPLRTIWRTTTMVGRSSSSATPRVRPCSSCSSSASSTTIRRCAIARSGGHSRGQRRGEDRIGGGWQLLAHPGV